MEIEKENWNHGKEKYINLTMIDMGASLVSLKPRRKVFQAGRNSKLCQMLLGGLVRHIVFNILKF